MWRACISVRLTLCCDYVAWSPKPDQPRRCVPDPGVIFPRDRSSALVFGPAGDGRWTDHGPGSFSSSAPFVIAPYAAATSTWAAIDATPAHGRGHRRES